MLTTTIIIINKGKKGTRNKKSERTYTSVLCRNYFIYHLGSLMKSNYTRLYIPAAYV